MHIDAVCRAYKVYVQWTHLCNAVLRDNPTTKKPTKIAYDFSNGYQTIEIPQELARKSILVVLESLYSDVIALGVELPEADLDAWEKTQAKLGKT